MSTEARTSADGKQRPPDNIIDITGVEHVN
jgi:hypothetical protein